MYYILHFIYCTYIIIIIIIVIIITDVRTLYKNIVRVVKMLRIHAYNKSNRGSLFRISIQSSILHIYVAFSIIELNNYRPILYMCLSVVQVCYYANPLSLFTNLYCLYCVFYYPFL